jgi:hypothetical protein
MIARVIAVLVAIGFVPCALHAQTSSAPCPRPLARFLGAQTTFIGHNLPGFYAAYSGQMSLTAHSDKQLSQSYGVYSGSCVVPHLEVYLDAEMVRGSGISHASGLGAVTNGDVLRQGSVDLGTGPYVARAFVRSTWDLPSGERDTIAAAPDALPGVVSARRIEITAGRFAASDIFDLNRYANSTRTQFLDWVLFNEGAWDFAADTRGYSNGVSIAWISPLWALRAGSFQMPTFANGNIFDNDIANARGDNIELTVAMPKDAVVRLLGYINHARMGRYDVAIAKALAEDTTPNIVADDAPGRRKYGVAMNADLPLADSGATGLFGRIGWNDGRTESFAFTEVDRHISVGAQVSGAHWTRHDDIFGIALGADGLSGPHRRYLADGGLGFLLGDGRLRYRPETLGEAYYRLQIGRHVAISPDVILIINPGDNHDRGPAVVLTLRGRLVS